MARIFLVGVNGGVLALGYLALAVLAQAYTADGFVTQPSRISAAIAIVKLMPLDATTLLPMLQNLLWAPLATALIALVAAIPSLRSLRWLACAANAAALGYLLPAFPILSTLQNTSSTILAASGVFLSGILFSPLISARPASGAARKLVLFFLAAFCLAASGIVVHGAIANDLAPRGLASSAGCALGYVVSFFCLAKAVEMPKRTAALLLPPIAFAGAAFVFALPLAPPIVAGIALLGAVHIR